MSEKNDNNKQSQNQDVDKPNEQLFDTMKILKSDIEKAMKSENETVVTSINLEETQVIDREEIAKLVKKTTQEKEQKKKRDESKRFLKIYMFALISVVVVLIALSFTSQSKLTQQIQYLTDIVDTNDEETSSAMMTVEKLQILNEEQSKTINEQSKTIKELEKYQKEAEFLDLFWQIQKNYYRENYTECLEYITTIEFRLTDYINNDVKSEYNAIKMSVLAHEEMTEQELDTMVKALSSQIDEEQEQSQEETE